jgi:type IV secretion system protein VirD4
MKPSKFLFLHLIIVTSIVITSLVVATQWLAYMLAYQRQLGAPLFVVHGYPIYAPKFLYWWYWYSKYAPKQFDMASYVIYLGVFLAIGYAIAAALMRAKKDKDPTYQGSAR